MYQTLAIMFLFQPQFLGPIRELDVADVLVFTGNVALTIVYFISRSLFDCVFIVLLFHFCPNTPKIGKNIQK